jgi:DNA-binding response OmpR family regulator
MPRILIIDDEVSVRTMLRRSLEEAGHTVFEASGGREGLNLSRRERTDVVVTDLYMPDTDGIEVIRELRRVSTHPKIICMSGGGQTEVFDWGRAALALGADRVLLKPFDGQRLLADIQEVLAGSAKPADAVPPSNPAEQRKSTRLPVYFPVSFGDGTLEQTGTVLDISPEGCRIRCPEASPALQYFQLRIQLVEPQDTLKVDLAVKRWARNGDLGIEFIRLEPAQQARLRWVIWNCHAAPPSPSAGSCLAA